MAARIKVMIVDESAVVRQVVAQTLAGDPGIEVIGAVADPVVARERMRAKWPDVLIIDIEMARVDGIGFVKKIVAERPTAVVVCSALTEAGAPATSAALAAGAAAIVTKPKSGLKRFLEDAAGDIVQAVRNAARTRVRSAPAATRPAPPVRPSHCADVMLDAGGKPGASRGSDPVIAIGTSTGGTQALEAILTRLPATSPGIVIVQHMPALFTAMFAERLHAIAQIEVREARHGDRVLRGRALIAPGDRHMMLRRNGAQYVVEVVDGPLVKRHKPSVDVLFRSVARFAGASALGIIMTGMGDDGARGLKEMHDAGAKTIAQDEASCVVFGMPKEAIKLGAVDLTLALDQIPAAIVSHGANPNI
jgi:two-component system chemotaxis response regulator CheB